MSERRGIPGLKGERGNQGNRGNPGATGATGAQGGLTPGQFDSFQRWIRMVSIVLVVFVGALFYQDHRSEVEGWEDDTTRCETTNQGRGDAAARDRDLALFAEQGAAARRASGDVGVARGYEAIARRSRLREQRTLGRRVDCGETYPKPTLLPF